MVLEIKNNEIPKVQPDFVAISKQILALIDKKVSDFNIDAKYKIKTVTAKKVFNSEYSIIDGICALDKFLNNKTEFKIVFASDLRQIFNKGDMDLATAQLKEINLSGDILIEDLYLEDQKKLNFNL